MLKYSVFDLDHAVYNPQEFRTVRDQHDTQRVFEFRKHFHEPGLRILVERCCWFVQDQESRFRSSIGYYYYMTRLDDYQSALRVIQDDVSEAELVSALDAGGAVFVSSIVDHGLGPMWHERTNRDEFHASRLSAEALYLAQEQALREIDAALKSAGIDYAVIKGAASRILLYENPAVRACYDLDLLVRPDDRVHAATALVKRGFVASIEAHSISRVLVLSRGGVDIDLHWGLLREGRLRSDITQDMVDRRQRVGDTWVLSNDDALFVLLVHPAFAKHLAGWGMGLHRVTDIVAWLQTQSFDWQAVRDRLRQAGVKTAAWATLCWVEMLMPTNSVQGLDEMLADLRPGSMRRAWLERWLRHDLSAQTSGVHWLRLLGFSVFLHDTPRDSVRALIGRYRAHARSAADLAAFEGLSG